MSDQISTLILPSNPADQKAIMDAMFQVSAAYTRIEGERDYVKGAIKDLADKFQIPKKILSKFARDYHKNALTEKLNENDDYEAFVSTLVPSVVE